MTEFNYAVIDTETNIKNKTIGGNKGSAFWPSNKIVLGQGCYDAEPFWGGMNKVNFSSKFTENISFLLSNFDMLIGHNIKFDLLHIRKACPVEYDEWVANGGTVWDTQIVEYLITGQSSMFATLNALSEKYGGTQKPDRIKEYWDNGIDTEDIPASELLEYLDGDVDNTSIIFEAQAQIVNRENLYPLITTQMDALMAVAEMEWNGMYMDVASLRREQEKLELGVYFLEAEATAIMRGYLPRDLKADINPHSAQQLSTVLFGGEVKVVKNVEKKDERGVPLVYKSGVNKGKVKTKKVEETVKVKGMGITPIGDKNKNGVYPTDDATLEKLKLSRALTVDAGKLINYIQDVRGLKKDISTYYIGYSQLIWPDGCLHPNFNQCATGTGRLSCSTPNVQNANAKED